MGIGICRKIRSFILFILLLDPTKSNIPILVDNIKDVVVNGKSLGLGGYIDIGLLDTMEDLLVNFIGAFVFFYLWIFFM